MTCNKLLLTRIKRFLFDNWHYTYVVEDPKGRREFKGYFRGSETALYDFLEETYPYRDVPAEREMTARQFITSLDIAVVGFPLLIGLVIWLLRIYAVIPLK